MVTIAGEFEREVAVHLHLVDNRIFPLPSILSVDSMRRRYVIVAMEVVSDEAGAPDRLTFYDGSVAQRGESDKRIWREVHDA